MRPILRQAAAKAGHTISAATLLFIIATAAVGETRPLVIDMLDTSGSLSKTAASLRKASIEVALKAPESVLLASMTFDIEVGKSPVVESSRRAEAVATLERNERGAWTDPARGIDAAMALAQQAGSSDPVLVIFTDGRASLPPSFRDRAGFADVLVRELQRPGREHVRCVLVIVGASRLAGLEQLGDRITLVRSPTVRELDGLIAGAILPALNAALAARSAPPAGAPTVLPPQTPAPTRGHGLLLALLAAAMLLIAASVAVARHIRRRATIPAAAHDQARALTEPSAPATSGAETSTKPDELVAILRAAPRDGSSAVRTILRAGDQATVGGSTFATISLASLVQPETLDVCFDGEAITVVRRLPKPPEATDRVEIGDREAPYEFAWPVGTEVRVGDYLMHVTVVPERQAATLVPMSSKPARLVAGRPSPGRTPDVLPHFDL